MVAVPNASAPTAWTPPTAYSSSSPIMQAAAIVAGSALPCLSGGVTTTIRSTPATLAGTPAIIIIDGKEPLPRGTYNPTDAMGNTFSPATMPGLISISHDGGSI